MRIITGDLKGRLIKAPIGKDTRPTSDRVKESLFNIIRKEIPETKILDLYAGTGNLGIEAISRGADYCYFIENNRDTLKILLYNINNLNINNKCEVFNTDAYLALKNLYKKSISFDLIFLDPPYFKNEIQKSIEYIDNYNLLNKNGIIITEYDAKELIPEFIGRYKKYRTEKYGRTSISFWNEGEK